MAVGSPRVGNTIQRIRRFFVATFEYWEILTIPYRFWVAAERLDELLAELNWIRIGDVAPKKRYSRTCEIYHLSGSLPFLSCWGCYAAISTICCKVAR